MSNREITADYKYVYDPKHEHKPLHGIWKMTGSGWSSSGDDEEDGKTSPSKSTQDDTANNVSKPGANDDDAVQEKNEQPVEENTVEAPAEEDAQEDGDVQEDTDNTDNAPADEPVDNAENVNDAPEDGGEDDFADFTAPSPRKQDEPDGQNPGDGSDELEMEIVDDEAPADDSFEDGGDTATDDEQEQAPAEEEENDFNLDESNDGDSMFADEKQDEFTDEGKHPDYISKMNAFVEKFDEGEGKENDITFKAVASNLDWDNLDEVLALAGHCDEIGLESAYEVLAFLYHSYKKDADAFDNMLAEEMQ